MFRAIWEFAQSQDCVVHSQNPEIALNLEIAQYSCDLEIVQQKCRAISGFWERATQSRDCTDSQIARNIYMWNVNWWAVTLAKPQNCQSGGWVLAQNWVLAWGNTVVQNVTWRSKLRGSKIAGKSLNAQCTYFYVEHVHVPEEGDITMFPAITPVWSVCISLCRQQILFEVCERGYGVTPLQITDNVYAALLANITYFSFLFLAVIKTLMVGKAWEQCITLLDNFSK